MSVADDEVDGMSMEVTAWHAMHRAAHAREGDRPFSMATLRRIGSFARPHRRMLVGFLLLSVVMAVLGVATPMLAGRVVDAIVDREAAGLVIGLAALIAVIAVAEAGLGLLTRRSEEHTSELQSRENLVCRLLLEK